MVEVELVAIVSCELKQVYVSTQGSVTAVGSNQKFCRLNLRFVVVVANEVPYVSPCLSFDEETAC